jgi:hypothetical protein
MRTNLRVWRDGTYYVVEGAVLPTKTKVTNELLTQVSEYNLNMNPFIGNTRYYFSVRLCAQ